MRSFALNQLQFHSAQVPLKLGSASAHRCKALSIKRLTANSGGAIGFGSNRVDIHIVGPNMGRSAF
jgi:hypothetical protein